MEHPLNKFDQSIKDSFDNFELPYNESHWEDLQKDLKIVSPGIVNYFSGITTGLVATGLVFMSMLYLFSESTPGNGNEFAEQIVERESPETVTANAGSDTNKGASAEDADLNDSESAVSEKKYEESSQASSNSKSAISNAGSTAKNSTSKKENTSRERLKMAAIVDSKLASNIKKGCTGLTIDFEAKGLYGRDAKYLWNFGDGFFSNAANPSHTFNKEGTFDVSLSVTSPATGQITSNVVQGMIEVVEAPVAQTSIEIVNPNGVQFANKSFNAHESEWLVDGENAGSKAQYYMDLRSDDVERIDLVVYNTGGCADTLSQFIRTTENHKDFPTAISLSDNQSFAPGGKTNGIITSFKIFDARGNVVFEGDAMKGWNGKKASEETAPLGNYYWVMVVEKKNDAEVFSGQFNLR